MKGRKREREGGSKGGREEGREGGKIQRTSESLNALKLPVSQQLRADYPFEPHFPDFALAIKYLSLLCFFQH